MTTITNGKSAPAGGPVEIYIPVGSSALSVQSLSAPARYNFNLTDGNTMIRDQEGNEAVSLEAAVLAAMEAVDELRAQDSLNSDEWQGWRLDIIDVSGRALLTIPLDVLSAH